MRKRIVAFFQEDVHVDKMSRGKNSPAASRCPLQEPLNTVLFRQMVECGYVDFRDTDLSDLVIPSGLELDGVYTVNLKGATNVPVQLTELEESCPSTMNIANAHPIWELSNLLKVKVDFDSRRVEEEGGDTRELDLGELKFISKELVTHVMALVDRYEADQDSPVSLCSESACTIDLGDENLLELDVEDLRRFVQVLDLFQMNQEFVSWFEKPLTEEAEKQQVGRSNWTREDILSDYVTAVKLEDPSEAPLYAPRAIVHFYNFIPTDEFLSQSNFKESTYRFDEEAPPSDFFEIGVTRGVIGYVLDCDLAGVRVPDSLGQIKHFTLCYDAENVPAGLVKAALNPRLEEVRMFGQDVSELKLTKEMTIRVLVLNQVSNLTPGLVSSAFTSDLSRVSFGNMNWSDLGVPEGFDGVGLERVSLRAVTGIDESFIVKILRSGASDIELVRSRVGGDLLVLSPSVTIDWTRTKKLVLAGFGGVTTELLRGAWENAELLKLADQDLSGVQVPEDADVSNLKLDILRNRSLSRSLIKAGLRARAVVMAVNFVDSDLASYRVSSDLIMKGSSLNLRHAQNIPLNLLKAALTAAKVDVLDFSRRDLTGLELPDDFVIGDIDEINLNGATNVHPSLLRAILRGGVNVFACQDVDFGNLEFTEELGGPAQDHGNSVWCFDGATNVPPSLLRAILRCGVESLSCKRVDFRRLEFTEELVRYSLREWDFSGAVNLSSSLISAVFVASDGFFRLNGVDFNGISPSGFSGGDLSRVGCGLKGCKKHFQRNVTVSVAV